MQRFLLVAVCLASLGWLGCSLDSEPACADDSECPACEAPEVAHCDTGTGGTVAGCTCIPSGGTGGTGGTSADCTDVPADADVIEDKDFADADWDEMVIPPPGADTTGTSAEQALSGGVDGASDPYRSMTHEITNPDTSHPDCSVDDCSFTLGVLHEYIADGETYTPSMQGAIDHIDYSESHIITAPAFAGAAVGWTFAVWQDETRYTYQQDPGASAFTDETWNTEYRCGLTAADFMPTGLNLEDGGEITFGYIRSNSNTTPDSTQRNVHGIDNFRVVLVP